MEDVQQNAQGENMILYRAKYFVAMVVGVLLSACTASGPTYSEYVEKLPPGDEFARIYVYRTADGFIRPFGSDVARVWVDGVDVGGCACRGFNMYSLPAGTHTLVVDNLEFPGECSIEIEVESGKDYYYEVQRLMAPFGGAASGLWLAGPAIGAGAEAVIFGFYAGFYGGALLPDCGGAFSIESVNEETGRDDINDLSYCERCL